MAGDAKTPRMGDALAVHQQYVGAKGKALQDGDQDGYLPEGEQARHVGEGNLRPRDPALNRLQSRIAQHHYSGRGPTIRANPRDIQSCNESRLKIGGGGVDSGGEAELDGCGLGGREVPGWISRAFTGVMVA